MFRIIIYIILTLYSSTSLGYNKEIYIPITGKELFPLVIVAQEKYFKEFPLPAYYGGLIEHESCISLKSSRCWSSKSRLKTSREEGAGLGQFTRAYRKDGRLRFDKIKELRDKYPRELGNLTWNNVYSRPDLQIRGLVLLIRDIYKRLPSTIDEEIDKLAFTDASYNGGSWGVNKDRRLCGLTKGCDPTKWFNNVELTCSKSKRILYGNRNACDINRHHVKDVIYKRTLKYINLYMELQ